MRECTYATTTCTSSAVNHFFVFIWWVILINQIKILLTLHLTQHVCCFSCDWGTENGRFCLSDFFGFSKAKMVKRHKKGIMARGGLCLWSSSFWLRWAGGEHQRLQALRKACPESVHPMGTGEGDRGVGEDSIGQTAFECSFIEGIFP